MKVLLAIDEPDFADAIAEFVLTHKWEPDTEFKVISVIEPLKVGSMMAALPGPMLDCKLVDEPRAKLICSTTPEL